MGNIVIQNCWVDSIHCIEHAEVRVLHVKLLGGDSVQCIETFENVVEC